MSLKDLKVTDEEFSSYGVISQPDTLTGTPEENKAVFDALIRRVSIEHINKLIDELSTSGAADMGTEPFGAVTATTVQAALEQIYALIGSTYSGTDGAGKVGFSGTSSIQASNVQAAIEAVQANLAALIALLKSQQGAAQVGNAPIAGLTATTVQAALAELRDQIQDIVAGSIPSQSVTTEQIQDGAVTAEKIGFTGEDIPTSDTDSTSISSQLSNRLLIHANNAAGLDCNLLIKDGRYQIQSPNILNAPPWIDPTNGHFFIDVFHHMDIWVRQIAYEVNSTRIYTRARLAGSWSQWEPLATATPPQEFDLPLAEPYDGNGKYLKTQENIVIVDVNIGTTGGSEISNNNMTFATLPAGFRPSRVVYSDAVTLTSDSGAIVGIAQFWIDANGSLNLRVPSGSYRLRGELIFLAAD